MKAVIQRVNQAQVAVETKTVGKIGRGYLVLLGVSDTDEKEDAVILADKLVKMRIMADKSDKMNLSISDVKGEVLIVSQFTLLAETSKGNRPSFIHAAAPAKAEELYKMFVDEIKNRGIRVATGKFGAYMKITARLDGPVTIIL
jgi:D-aminoacyl-tRNA deacylase